jgi:hypothetical protein
VGASTATTYTHIEGLETCSELLPALLRVSDRAVKDRLLDSPTIRSLLRWKWKILRRLWVAELFLFVLLLVSYVGWIVSVFDGSPSSPWSTAFCVSNLILVFPFLAIEVTSKLVVTKWLLIGG